jgi:hypothetical protein
MTVCTEKLRQFQQQHLESQVQCGEQIKSVPKAGCVKEWALIEIALNLQALNEKFEQFLQHSATTELPGHAAGSTYPADLGKSLPRT